MTSYFRRPKCMADMQKTDMRHMSESCADMRNTRHDDSERTCVWGFAILRMTILPSLLDVLHTELQETMLSCC